MTTYRVMTNNKLERALKMHSEGCGWNDIGKELNLHPYTVKWHLQRQGRKTNKEGVGRKITWDVEEGRRLRVEEKMPWKEIGKLFGVSGVTVCRYFKRHNIDLS